jgi:sensor histidine kinase YesM
MSHESSLFVDAGELPRRTEASSAAAIPCIDCLYGAFRYTVAMTWLQSRGGRGLVLFLGSTVVGLYFSSQFYVNFAPDEQMAWRRALAVNLTYYWLWGAAVPLILLAARRWRLESNGWPRATLVHLVFSSLITVVVIVIAESILRIITPDVRKAALSQAMAYGLRRNFHSSFPTYWLVLFVYYAYDYYAKFRDRELRASQLAARLTMSQLQALKMQLNPHFLFNTLNSISSLMYTNVEAADAMITRLGDFLRMTLANEGLQEVPLQQELDFLEHYLGIERIRLEERLIVTMDVADEALGARVPNLGLQPLVENAIHHGIAELPRGGAIALTARRDGELLRIAIRNDRPGSEVGTPVREGIGLTNIRARLAQLYGAAHELRFDDCSDGALLVSLAIPFRVNEA